MYGLLFIIAIIIIILFFQNYQNQLQQCSSQHKETQNQLKQKISSLEKNLNQVQSQTRQVTSSPPIENYQSDIILPNVATNNLINKNPQTLNALDRIYNPLPSPHIVRSQNVVVTEGLYAAAQGVQHHPQKHHNMVHRSAEVQRLQLVLPARQAPQPERQFQPLPGCRGNSCS